MAKKNIKSNKKSKLDIWLPICSMGGTIIGSVFSFMYENVILALLGACIGLILGTILGLDDIDLKSNKGNDKKESKTKKTVKKQTKTKKK